MLSAKDFVNAPIYEIPSLGDLVGFCGDLRKKDPLQKIVVKVHESQFRGNIRFPFSDFCIIGEGKGATITGSLYANQQDENGHERTTWKTATLKLIGDRNVFENIAFVNDAGDPEKNGQEVALAIFGDGNAFLSCSLKSTQDTLFVGPLPDDLSTRYLGFLPEEERYHEGTAHSSFLFCRIEGSVDFVFGAGDADFYRCDLVSLDDGRKTAFVAAPSHSLKDPYGFLFAECRFLSGGTAQDSVYLARPWRDYGKCVFVNCAYGAHIKAEGFSEWAGEQRWRTARFEEYPLLTGRVCWVRNQESAPLPERYRDAIESLKKISV